MTKENNKTKIINIELSRLINIFLEGGQVFDMNLEIKTENEKYQIEIIRGTTVEIKGDGSVLHEKILGNGKSV